MIVSDAGPIIVFARIGRLSLLHEVTGSLLIPDAVYNEIVVQIVQSRIIVLSDFWRYAGREDINRLLESRNIGLIWQIGKKFSDHPNGSSFGHHALIGARI